MRIRKLTDAVAAEFFARRSAHDAAAERVAARILADVRRNGDAALFRWALRLDGLNLNRGSLWISRAELRAARGDVPRDLLRAIEHAARNIRRVAEQQRPRSWTITVEPGVRVGQRVTPLGTIGCYIPGGRFSLFSTLLMTAIPAQVAGVKRIVVACPEAGPGIARRRGNSRRDGNRPNRRRAGHWRVCLRHAIDSARGQNLRSGKSLRHRCEAPGFKRLRDRYARRTD